MIWKPRDTIYNKGQNGGKFNTNYEFRNGHENVIEKLSKDSGT